MNELNMQSAYNAFNSIRDFLQGVSCLEQSMLEVVDNRLDFIKCTLRGDFGGDFTDDTKDGLLFFVKDELLPQCRILASYELKAESTNLVHMRVAGRTIAFYIKDQEIDNDDPYSELVIRFKLDKSEYSAFLQIAN